MTMASPAPRALLAYNDDTDLAALTSNLDRLSMNNSNSGSMVIQSCIRKLKDHQRGTRQLMNMMNQVLQMSIDQTNDILAELETIDVESIPEARRRKTNVQTNIEDEDLMVDVNFREVGLQFGANQTFLEELQATVSDEDVKNFSKQIYPAWMRSWFQKENSRKHRAFFLKVMLFVALKDYVNYIPKNVIIHSQEQAMPYIIVYASSHATIFFHLCGAALKELEKKKITLSSLFLEKALLEIRSKIETGRISSVSTPVAAGARTTRSQTGSLPRAQIQYDQEGSEEEN